MASSSHSLQAGFLEFVEGLILPSIVLLLVDGEEVQTGFFVSTQGDICTCFHGFFLREDNPIQAVWRGKHYPATIKAKIEAADFVLLAIPPEALEGERTPPLPVYTEPVQGQLKYHTALTMGYAGLENRSIPVRERVFTGRLGEQCREGLQERIEFLDLGVGKGNSGAPIFDLLLFRVVGYVRSSFSKTQRLGDGLTLQHLIANSGELAPAWAQAGEQFDREKVEYYRFHGLKFYSVELSKDVLRYLIQSQNQHLINQKIFAGVFIPELYVCREAEAKLEQFIKDSEARILMLVGTTGSGKSNILLHLVQALNDEDSLPLLLSCDELEDSSLLGAIGQALKVEDYSLEKIPTLLQQVSDATWVVIFDGYNEWTHADRVSFQNTLTAIDRLVSSHPELNLKFIFSTRSEFLQEKMADFYFTQSRAFDTSGYCLHLFYFDDQQHPYVEVKNLESSSTAGLNSSELQAMFEHYRKVGWVSFGGGQKVGICPNNSFAELPDTVKNIINRPVILKLFMMRYHNMEVPNISVRSSFIDDIIYPVLLRESDSDLFREDISLFLMELAFYIFDSLNGEPCSYATLVKQSWHNDKVLRYLLEKSPLLQRNVVGGTSSRVKKNTISFGSDWLFEYYLATYIWETCLERPALAEKCAYIEELQAHSFEKKSDAHLLGALLVFGEWALTKDSTVFPVILHLINSERFASFNAGYTHAFLDHIRTNYSLDGRIPTEDRQVLPGLTGLFHTHAGRFNDTGFSRLLDYVMHLERLDEIKDALALLNIAEDFWAPAAAENQAKRYLSLAYNHLHGHAIDQATQFAAQVDESLLSQNLVAKRNFVLGRCLQFRQRYSEAQEVYERSVSSQTYFGYLCNHQLAFIKVIRDSDYVAAARLLEHIIARMSLTFSSDEQLTSQLLHASCLIQLGRYVQAENNLQFLIKKRQIRRQKQGMGKALRTLADLYLRQFNAEKALEALDASFESLKGKTHYLTSAFARDIRASIYGLLQGNQGVAFSDVQKALEFAELAQHNPSKSWSHQTLALLHALEGEIEPAKQHLKEARRYGFSPYQELREKFIRLLARYFSPEERPNVRPAEVTRLRNRYLEQGYGWYPGVLALIGAQMAGKKPDSAIEVITLFGEDINAAGLLQSYLYARIFHESPS